MADYRTPGYDLQDETNCADSCEAVIALCELVDELITDIQHLELECISTRHLLSKYLEADKGELLRMDILSNLPPRHSSEPAYELFKNIIYNGGDPMEFREYTEKVHDAINGRWPCFH